MAAAGGARFEGRVAIVTGGGGGIGRATARRFAADGASVVVADISPDAANAAVEEIAGEGGTATAFIVDVTDEGSVKDMVAAATGSYGRLDVIHNNAADIGRANDDLDLADLPVEVWDRRMAVNARGVMLGCKHAVAAMRRQGSGVIVNMASVSGLVGTTVNAAYGSSKAAVIGLTRYVATMYGRDGIRCVCVAPGMVLTPALQAAPERRLAQFGAERLLPWGLEPDDLAATVTWLASDEARGITGQTIVVDAGVTAHRPRPSMEAWHALLLEHPDWLEEV
jgi:NAD(P)-dependent dehydrogenase (short-subunit alcohol dehydrogenase family)